VAVRKLLEPTTIGSVELRNRIAMPPMTTCFASETNGVSPWEIDYFTERAKGGVGLIIVGGVCVESKTGKPFLPGPFSCIDDDKYIAGYSRLVDAIHEHGAKVAIQLYHPGRQTILEDGSSPVSPSAAQAFFVGQFPMPKARALSIEEINWLENAFAEAARRAKTAGFDAVLIDGGAGYLIAQFMSPFVNKRTDEYGGDLQRRMHFPLRIIEKTKQKVGTDYPLLFDLPVDEFIKGGIRPEDSKVMARILEDNGIEAFRMHGALFETYHYITPPACIPRGVYAPLAKGIKGAIKQAKVMLGHRINDPLLAEEILQNEMADIILMGRPLLADPELPIKTKEERFSDIRKCIACNCCTGRIGVGLPVTCTVNPMVGKEKEYQITTAQKPKRVFIVGGGVGGMEAARVAALRGHKVTLWEKNAQLGGMAIIAAIPPHKYEIKNLLDYYIAQLQKLKVDVRLGEEITKEEIQEHHPDVVITATGAEPALPNIPGNNMSHVMTAKDVLTERMKVRDKVVIIGGGQTGLETAEFLAEKGKKVTILEMLPEVGIDMELYTKIFMLQRLKKAGVAVRENIRVDEITEKGVIAKKNLFEADSVIIAVGLKPANDVYASLKGKFQELYAIGDSVRPRRLLDAVHEGARVARLI
jgi:2,4-dienoyl-CoA reductase-like NADH-dependent reductase (Old Yellow Enzyme family)/thioredoxin reductase